MKKTLAALTALSTLAIASPLYAATCQAQPVYNAANQVAYGWDNNREIGASLITMSTTCTVTEIGIRFFEDSPRADDSRVTIYADSSGTPGSVLETGSEISGSGPSAIFGTSTFAGTTQLLSGTSYWIAYDAATQTGVFFIGLTGEATDGTTKVYNGTSWIAEPNQPDKTFYYIMDGTIAAAGGGSQSLRADIITFDF